MDQSTNKTIKNLKTPVIFKIIIFIIFFLSIIAIISIYDRTFFTNLFTGSSSIDSKTSSTIFFVIFFAFLVIGIILFFIPESKNLLKFLFEMKEVVYIIIYTIFLILLFRLLPSNILNDYAFIITPATILISILLFYKSFTTNLVENFGVIYERIKTIILFFSLITILTLFYNKDPGGYINKYFGYSLILTILLSVFSFLYLIVILTFPDNVVVNDKSKNSNFLNNFSKISIFGSILFIIFLILITVGIEIYPDGFLNDISNSTGIIILLIFIFILWIVLLVLNLFSDVDFNNFEKATKINVFKNSLLILFGLSIACILIIWLTYNIQTNYGKTDIISLVLNIIIILLVLTLIYRTINVKIPDKNLNIKKNNFFSIIINFILYIPCLVSELFTTTFDKASEFGKNQYNSTPFSTFIILFVLIILIILLFFMPGLYNKIYDKINLQGGDLLLNEPIETNTLVKISDYQKLNGSESFNYQYGLSFWIYIDADPPNTNPSYSNYTSLLNYGNKPNVLYKASTNTLIITISSDNPLYSQESINLDTSNTNEEIIDGKINKIIYKNKNFLLQKWNNIIINYSGGTLDIFLNNELVKSSIEVVPYMTYDDLTVGEDNGINGKICNIVYFNQPLTTSNMFYLYKMVQSKNPPITNK